MSIFDNKKIITATSLNDSNTEILKEAEEQVIVFNRKRIRKALMEAKKLLRIELNDNQAKLPDEEIERIKLEIVADKETNLFRINKIKELSTIKNNYNDIRKDIQGLNDLWYDSYDIEKAGIQKHENLLPYDEVILQSTYNTQTYFEVFKSIIDKFKELELEAYNRIKETQNKRGKVDDLNYKTLDIFLKIREMYTVTKAMDDFEIFERYGTDSNLDFANQLSDIFIYLSMTGNKDQNIVNIFSSDYLSKRDSDKLLNITKLMENQIISDKMLGYLFSNKFISNNSVMTLATTYTENTNLTKVFRQRTLGELLIEITNMETIGKSKVERQQMYMTYGAIRPTKDDYYTWSGLQVFDLDLKSWIIDYNGNIDELKAQLHKYMSNHHWYLWICKSASGRGLHIYTKVTPPHHVYTEAHENNYLSEYWHKINYLTKQSVIYDYMHRIHNDETNLLEFPLFMSKSGDEYEIEYLDNSVSRITAGIRLSYDTEPFVNENFVDMHVGWALGKTYNGFEDMELINKLFLRSTKIKNIIDNELAVKNINDYRKAPEIDLSKFITLGADLDNITILPRNKINYITRYNVCNTLASLFGKDGLQIAHTILDSHACNNVSEINSFYGCAISNGKKPSKIGLEILKRVGIVKSIDDELQQEVSQGFKGDLKQQIENVIKNDKDEATFALTSMQYLSDIGDELDTLITGDAINIILSPAGSGKTHWIKQQARAGKKICLVLPYVSIIKNKIEKDEEIVELFDCYYDSANLNELEYGRNVVTTIDKFSRIRYEKFARLFDYIYIDESHLMFTSSYRIEATANLMKKIKEAYFMSSNDPLAAKLVLLTGTETGETHFFQKIANVIRIHKPMLDKKMQFLLCNDTLDAITRLSSKVAEYINLGYRIIIPTNKGEVYSEKMIGMVEYLLGRTPKYGYYKRSNNEQEICRLINDHDTVGDYEIIFCSNYLSVGIDITDKFKFVSMYLGAFSGFEIEQFNARVRKMGIESVYCIVTETQDGDVKQELLDEPNLILRLTDEDKVHFVDDKNISEAKSEFLATYDPVLRKITTPGFSLFQGKIQFNMEEYELVTFENKYLECMEHPVKVARELSKYGYQIEISTEFDGLSLEEQESLKQLGIDAAKKEKLKKHNLMIGTYVDLIKNDTYISPHGLEYTNTIEFIHKNMGKVIEDRDLADDKGDPLFVKIIYNLFAQPEEVIVRSKEALDKMVRPAKYLASRYSMTKAIDIIYDYVDDNGILRQKHFQRSINLLKLVEKSDANELAEPLTRIIEKIYGMIDKFETRKDYRIPYESYQSIIDSWTYDYIDMLGIKINTKYGFEKIRDGLTEMISDIAERSTSKNGIRLTYNKMPDQNNNTVLTRRSIDTLVTKMFNVTGEVTSSTARQKHIILEPQDF